MCTVSYTHLDVYKRQSVGCALFAIRLAVGFIFGKLGQVCFMQACATNKLLCRPHFSVSLRFGHSRWSDGLGCVLVFFIRGCNLLKTFRCVHLIILFHFYLIMYLCVL